MNIIIYIFRILIAAILGLIMGVFYTTLGMRFVLLYMATEYSSYQYAMFMISPIIFFAPVFFFFGFLSRKLFGAELTLLPVIAITSSLVYVVYIHHLVDSSFSSYLQTVLSMLFFFLAYKKSKKNKGVTH